MLYRTETYLRDRRYSVNSSMSVSGLQATLTGHVRLTKLLTSECDVIQRFERCYDRLGGGGLGGGIDKATELIASLRRRQSAYLLLDTISDRTLVSEIPFPH